MALLQVASPNTKILSAMYNANNALITDGSALDNITNDISIKAGKKVKVFNSGNTSSIQMYVGGTSTNGRILTDSTTNIEFEPGGGYVHPAVTSTTYLGAPSKKWLNVYSDTITATTGTFSGAISASSYSGGAVTSTSIVTGAALYTSAGILRIQHNSQNLDLDHDSVDAKYNTSLGVHKFNAAVSGNGAYINHSDRALKKNIVNTQKGLTELLQLRPREFERKGSAYNGKELGFVAQEVEAILPDMVYTHGDIKDKDNNVVKGVKGIASDNLLPLIVNALSEINERLSIVEKK